MSFDAFEARLQFLQLLRKLNASIQSIQKVTSFALRYSTKCGADLWEVILEECAKGTLNTRINILYFLDGLLDAESQVRVEGGGYGAFLARDLGEVVGRVVPNDREGVLNLRSARQILESWRTRRVIDPDTVESVLKTLSERTFSGEAENKKRGHAEAFSRNDILRRMEEDRERHKRLRERIWILPIPSLLPSRPIGSNLTPSPSSPFTPASPSTRAPQAKTKALGVAGGMLPPPKPPLSTTSKAALKEFGLNALEMEFEQTWETCGLLTDDELGRMKADALVAGLTVPFIS